MQRLGTVFACLGAAGVGIGLFALLDMYWRWIGVALGYPPLVSGLAGGGLLVVGIGGLLAGRLTTPRGGRAADQAPDATTAEHDKRA
jgi:hypothetical protein